jgi:hypothetical protein
LDRQAAYRPVTPTVRASIDHPGETYSIIYEWMIVDGIKDEAHAVEMAINEVRNAEEMEYPDDLNVDPADVTCRRLTAEAEKADADMSIG